MTKYLISFLCAGFILAGTSVLYAQPAGKIAKRAKNSIKTSTAEIQMQRQLGKEVRGASRQVSEQVEKEIFDQASQVRDLQQMQRQIEKKLKFLSETLEKKGFEVSADGFLYGTKTESLALLRRHEILLDTQNAFTTQDLSALRPKSDDPNRRVALPRAFQKDFDSRYLGYKYIGLRVEADRDIHEALREFKQKSVTPRLESMIAETENPPIMEGNVWLKTMKGLVYQLEIPKEQTYLFNDFNKQLLPVPYQVIGLVDTGYIATFNPELACAEDWPDMVSRIMMQLEIKGQVKWCEIEILPNGKFKVTPFLN